MLAGGPGLGTAACTPHPELYTGGMPPIDTQLPSQHQEAVLVQWILDLLLAMPKFEKWLLWSARILVIMIV
jgi:hypothetical protein